MEHETFDIRQLQRHESAKRTGEHDQSKEPLISCSCVGECPQKGENDNSKVAEEAVHSDRVVRANRKGRVFTLRDIQTAACSAAGNVNGMGVPAPEQTGDNNTDQR